MADRGDPRSSRQWAKLRASWATVIATSRVYCPRCGDQITSGQAWDLGHRVALRAGGSNGDARPEHAACNRAGAGVPAELRDDVAGRAAGPRRNGGPHRYPGPSRDW